MSTRLTISLVAAGLAVAAGASPAAAQHLHENDVWDECAIVLDQSLTQANWDTWVAEVANVVHFRPLADAQAMGRGNFEVALLAWSSEIDDRKDAWNDTFSHPDSTHYLVDEGDPLRIPGVTARVGVTDRLDVGAFFTQNPQANYGFYGAQVQYALANEAAFPVSLATRASLVHLFGPDDAQVGVYGLDVVASRDFSVLSDVTTLSPYAVVSGTLSRGHETTDKVDLDDAYAFGAQGTVGLALDVWAVRLGAEYTLGRVNTYSIKFAVGI